MTLLVRPRISVVMPVHNGEEFLCQTLDCILSQTFRDFELIIVDDGSSDGTSALLDSCGDRRIVRLRNEANRGVAYSRNRGNAMARGQYIAVHDSDDLSTLDRFEKQVTFLDSHLEIGIVGSQGMLLSNGQSSPMRVPIHNDEIQALLLGQNCLLHSSLMIRADLIRKVGGYNEQYIAAPDYDLVLRISELTQVANLADFLYFKRARPGSITYSPKGLWQKRCVLQAIEEALERRCSRGQVVALHRNFALACLAAACAESAFGEVDRITAYVQKALEVDMLLHRRKEAAQMLADYAEGYALKAGALGGNPNEIINRVFARWPKSKKPLCLVRRTRALVMAGVAFSAYRRQQWRETAVWASKSLVIWPAGLGNRGLVSIAGRSFLRLLLPTTNKRSKPV